MKITRLEKRKVQDNPTFICSRRNKGEELLLYRSMSDLSSLVLLLMLFRYFSALLSRYGVLVFDWYLEIHTLIEKCCYFIIIKNIVELTSKLQSREIFILQKSPDLLEEGRPFEVGVS